MSSPPAGNFSFLHAGWPELSCEAARAERAVADDPRTACFYARRTLELAVHWLYDVDRSLRRPYKDDLSAMLFEPTFQAALEPKIRTKMDLVRKRGNAAVHRRRPVEAQEAGAAVRELFHVLYWVARTYAVKPEHAPPADLAFDVDAIPRPPTTAQRRQTREALRKRAEENARRDAELAAERERSKALQAEIGQLRKRIDAAKAANEARADDHDYGEDETRDLYVDVLLEEAGWALDEARDREYEVSGMPNRSGKGSVDYVLWGDDGKPLAVVEAKRTRRDAQVGRQQAKLYADCLEREFGQRPLIFYTNGYRTWLWDDQRYPPRLVQGFLDKDELALAIQRRTSRKPLADVEIRTEIVDRHYQQRAIRKIAEAFERDNQRDALLVMATGAGKTRTVIALVDLLMRAGWVKRVLFLADRTALVKQASDAFKAQLPNVTTVNLVSDREAEGRVYVSTYPTMVGLIGEPEAGRRKRFGPGFFDLVIIDEAHRSVYAKYRSIFEYFDSLLVGLTATPKEEVDRDTYGLFNLEPGVPTDAYGLDQAVADRYLVPPRAIAVPLKFPREGVRYDDLSEEEREQWESRDWGDDGEVPDAVGADAVNRWLFNVDTVDKGLETLMTHGHRVAGGDRLGKTIVFAKNNDHAEFIAARFDANYPDYAGRFARVVTHKTEYAQSLIDDFSVKDKAPHVAISVDMLDTGIDVPEVVNLVFFKPIRSKTKFWQMIGRGTRLCRDLYGPGDDKKDFYVFDCCANVEYFNQDVDRAEGRLGPSLSQRLFADRVELILALAGRAGNGDETQAESGLRTDTIALLRARVAGMNRDNFLVRPRLDAVERYSDREPWERLDRDDAHELAARLADLPSQVKDDDEDAKRFDLIMLGLQLREVQENPLPGKRRLRAQVQEIAAALLEQTQIPAIEERAALLEELAGDEWWVGVTAPMLEQARRRIRDVVRLLEKRKRTVVYTNFTDELGTVEEVELSGIAAGDDFERFKEKARAYLRQHEDLVALQKLRRNKRLTALDVADLERVLLEAGVATVADLEGIRQASIGLGTFVRSLVGMERSAASEALSEFTGARALTADQIHFVDLIVEHLTQNGVMDPGRLYDAPFTAVAPRGPEGLFEDGDVEDLVGVLKAVGANAEPSSEAA
jgi:type I restriction enzyme R subunit